MIAEQLKTIAKVARGAALPTLAARAEEAAARLAFDRVHLVVIGEFNRGKTTLVNALIGSALLPMDIVPTTASIWVVERGDGVSAHAVRPDGARVALDATPVSLARLSADGDLATQEVKFIHVAVPSLAVGEDVVIIDTPGVNDINQARAEVTYGFLGNADAAIFVMDASSPLTRSEAEFLKGQVLTAHIDRIVFLLNKTSRLDPEEIDEAVEAARERLRELLGRDARVVACDAQRILASVGAGRADAAEPWGWPEVRRALDELLASARDRGTREATAGARARALAGLVHDALRARDSLARLSAEELEGAKTRFDSDLRAHAGALSRLDDYIASHGRERLHLLVARSLEARMADFVEAQLTRLSVQKGDFEPYVKQLLPRELQQTVKRWFEGHMPEVERYLVAFCGQLAGEYRAHFGESLAIPQDGLDARALPRDVQLDLQVDDSNEYLLFALPAASGLAAALLLTGPFAIVGFAAGGLAAKWKRDQDAAAARQALCGALPGVVDAAVQPLRKGIEEQIDGWFARLTAAVHAQYARDVARRREDFETAAAGRVAAASTGDVRAMMNDLEPILRSTP